MMVFKKKQIVLLALVIMVGIAGYLNWRYEANLQASTDPVENGIAVETGETQEANLGEAQMVNGETSQNDYFATSRMNRETARAKSLEILNATINNANATPEAKTQAQEQIAQSAKNVELEANIENLIKAKGFADAVVVIGEEDVTVTVKAQGLTAPETAKIKDVVMEQTQNNNIKIVEVN